MSRTSGVTTVEHEKGLHARPASVFVQTASEFEAEIEVVNAEGEAADAKSSIGVISLGVEPGDRIEITAQGDDAGRAVDRLVALVENGFELNGE
ncbi:HPr family phosphocarrier protein [Halobacteriales archaeon SW_10_66_29]|nr:MAG: HPr family phosphocarrier protein [Halobacteriales archaeon QH_7_66_37]PSQ37554.1 MAG: HPr family phosphocarrier protein [Halobacteriales archaeon SW_10_66_29]